jgi:hypothetical protein
MFKYKNIDLRFDNIKERLFVMGVQNLESKAPLVEDDFTAILSQEATGTIIVNFNFLSFAQTLTKKNAEQLITLLCQLWGPEIASDAIEYLESEESENDPYRYTSFEKQERSI